MEPILIYSFAMNSLVQLTVYGMTSVHGVSVTKIAMVENITELEQFTKKNNSEVNHVKAAKGKKKLVMKSLVRLTACGTHLVIGAHVLRNAEGEHKQG
jgi:hypothetical protein